MSKRSRPCLLWFFFLLLGIQTTQSQTTGVTSQSGFAIESDGSSSLGAATLQSGSDMRFGSAAPNYTIGEGHDILLGRSLGPDEAKLRVALKAPTSLTASELAGAWKLYEYKIDDSALTPLFFTNSGSITFQSSGNLDYDGSPGSFIISNGKYASISSVFGTHDFAVNASLDFMVSTSSNDEIHAIRILVRPESGGSTSQMAGAWNVGSFGVDFSEVPPDRWYDGDTLTATTGGSLSISGESLNWSADGSGSITFSEPEGSTTLSVNQSRSALVYTSTVGEAPTFGYEGAILLRNATAPSIASLAGNWTLHTFEFTDRPERDIIETYHPDGTTLARRERYTDGQLNGSPAVEQWDENGRQTRKDDYTDGILAYSLQTSYDGEALRSLNEYFYEDGALISSDEQLYHADGVTVGSRVLTTLTDNGLQVIEDTFKAAGKQTHQYVYLDGTLRTKIDWNYYSNGNVSSKGINDYTTGVHLLTVEQWFENGIKAGVTRYRNSELHGLQEGNDSSGNLVRETTYQHGIKHGRVRHWYDGGSQLWSEATFQDGEWHGLSSSWNENGRLSITQEYDKGLRHGEQYTYRYFESGNLNKKEYSIWEYDEQRRLEIWFWNASGFRSSYFLIETETQDLKNPTDTGFTTISEIFDDQDRLTYYRETRDGKDHGLDRHWTEGILDEEDNYKEGQLHGRSRRFNSISGNIESDEYYEDGLLHGPFKYYNDGVLEEEGNHVLGLREGLITSYNNQGTTTATYRNDILHGPYNAPDRSGEYLNGFEHGIWSYFWDGQLNRRTEYSNGTIHGTEEYFQNGGLYLRERYSDGLLDGLRERFDGGKLSSETTYSQGVEIGPRISYHDNGREASIVNVDAGLAHGSAKRFDDRGRTISSGNYNHGVQTGTWTTRSYNSEGNLINSDTNNYGSPDPTENRRGIKGRVTSNGIGLPEVRLTIGADRSTTTNPDGTYLLEIGEYSGSTELTISHPNFKDKTTSISLPSDYNYSTQNFTLDQHTSPTFELGEPDMPGTFFLEGVSFPTYFSDLKIPGKVEGEEEQNGSKLIWLKPRQPAPGEFTYPWYDRFLVDPGRDVASNGDAGEIFLRSAPGIESSKISLPTYTIAKNPAWAQKLGGWGTTWNGESDQPGEYRLSAKWPKEPFDLGIDRDTLGEFYWPIWSQLPVIGDDLGLFDVQFKVAATALTTGTGQIEFGGQGEVRAAKKTLRIEADGEGDLAWGSTLSISRASVLIRASLTHKEDLGALSFFPILADLEKNLIYGGFLKRLNGVAKISIELGGGVGARFPIDTSNGSLKFSPTEAELNFRTTGEVEVGRFPAEIKLSHKSVGLALFGLEGERPYPVFKSFTLTGKSEAQFRVFDFKKSLDPIEHKITYPGEAPSDHTPFPIDALSGDIDPIKPGFLSLGDYARFRSDISVFSDSNDIETNAETPQALVNNVYPHANLALAEQNETRALAYIHYDPDKPEGQSTRLYYSIDTGSGFSEPAPVHNQARADFGPQIAFLGDGRLVAVWETSQLDQIAFELEDRVTGLEIAWSVYDLNSGNWSTPALLSNNAYFDYNPILGSSEQGLMVMWQSNPDNQLLPTPQSPGNLNYTIWSGNAFGSVSQFPHAILPAERGSLAYDGSQGIYAWINDEDGDPSTVDDSELYWSEYESGAWQTPVRGTNNDQSDSAPKAFCLNGGQFEIAWINGSDIVRIGDFNTNTIQVIRASDGDTPPQFDLSCSADGKIAVLWVSIEDVQTDLHLALYDPTARVWSDEVALTDDERFEASPAFTLDNNGKLLAAFLSEHTDSEQRDLHWLECELGRDLSIEGLSIAPTEAAPGQFDITASVANLGALSSGSTKVDFYQGDPDNGGTYLGELAVNLKGGEEAELVFQSGVLSEGPIYVRIDPDNTVDELDESNNTASSDLNPTDLAANYFTWDRDVSDETSLTLKGTVTNNGREAIANVPVALNDESGTIFETTIASLEPGESAAVETTFATPVGNEHRFTLIVDPDDTLGEPNRSDNEFPIIVTLAQLQDGDNDGMANDWEELYFATLERDGDSDFDADGLSDRFEFLTQNNPADPSSTFPFTIEPHATDPGKVVIRFPTIAGRVYRIQRTSDFINWTNDSFHLGTGDTISASADTDGEAGDLNGFRILVGTQ